MTRQRILSIATKIFAGSFVLLVIGLILPQKVIMPVEGATRKSYSQNSFWTYPWGKSVTHKGVDIFAKKGTDVHPATAGIVLI
jgi:peptidoglycan LD-endopeptidase LytH